MWWIKSLRDAMVVIGGLFNVMKNVINKLTCGKTKYFRQNLRLLKETTKWVKDHQNLSICRERVKNTQKQWKNGLKTMKIIFYYNNVRVL